MGLLEQLKHRKEENSIVKSLKKDPDIASSISKIEDEEMKSRILRRLKGKIKSRELYFIISSFKDENKKIELLEEYNEILGSEFISGVISELISSKHTIALVLKYKNSIDSSDLKYIFKRMNISKTDFDNKEFVNDIYLKVIFNSFPEDFDINQNSYRDKLVYLGKYLVGSDDEIFQTIKPNIFLPEYLELFQEKNENHEVIYPSLRKIGKDERYQEVILSIPQEVQPIFKIIYKEIVQTDSDYTVMLTNVFNSIFYNKDLLLEVQKSGNYSSDIINSLIFVLSKKEVADKISTVDDLINLDYNVSKNYENAINTSDDINEIKNAILFRKYGMTLKEAQSFCSRYACDLNHNGMKLDANDEKIIAVLTDIKSVVNNENIDLLRLNELYKLNSNYHDDQEYLSVKKYRYYCDLESEVRKMYAKSLNRNLINVEDLKEIEQEKIPTSCTQKIYKAFDEQNNSEFSCLITSLGAYAQDYVKPNDYKEDWLRPKNTYKAFCSSLISNQMLGTANIKYACLGFSSIPEQSLLLQAPFDIVSDEVNKLVSPTRFVKDSNIQFLFPNRLIDYTRHTHNELCIERLMNDGKIQPDYIVYMTEEYNYENIKEYEKSDYLKLLASEIKGDTSKIKTVEDFQKFLNKDKSIESEKKAEIEAKLLDYSRWNNAVQASNDFGKPIVVIERKKIREHERKIIDGKVEEFKTTHNERLIAEILTRFENQRAGCRNHYIETGFEKQDATNIMELMYNEIIAMIKSGDLNAINCASELKKYINWELNSKKGKKSGNIGEEELGYDASKYLQKIEELEKKAQTKNQNINILEQQEDLDFNQNDGSIERKNNKC